MKKIMLLILISQLAILICGNIYVRKIYNELETTTYKVDVDRIVKRMRQGESILSIDLKEYPSVISVKEFQVEEQSKHSYVVEDVNGSLYRFEYEDLNMEQVAGVLNVVMISWIVLTIMIFLYIAYKIIRPFEQMSYYTTQLAKGNLSRPMKQEKSKYFKQFLWGMDMLREKLESDKVRELELINERKTLILSLSHDIKTPLAAIGLYTKALATNLYDTEEKKSEAIEGIEKNTAEIDRYIKEIVVASREDFLSFEIHNKGIYLEEVICEIRKYYNDRCKQLRIAFEVDKVENCLVYGDSDRLVEVIQNIMENAIKYGDGECIHISFSEEEDCKLVSIMNTGCTLKEEELQYVFDSFYRGRNSEKQKGSGLGLYICKELMHQMDGEVFARIDDDMFFSTVVIRKMS